MSKTVSFSQYQIYKNCPHQWYLNYFKGLSSYQQSIHTIFGTSIHEAMQHYLKVMYGESGAAADREDIIGIFKNKFKNIYIKKNLIETKQHFSSPDEMRDFHQDGLEIIKAFKKDKVKWFGIRGWELIGIEIPILSKLTQKQNLFMKGFIDVVAYDKTYDTYYIYDFKTSTRGWKDKDKKTILKYLKYYL